ncbi:MAG: hypothetical protein J6M65_12990 [Eubacterium sp.]|nr:hypothetical protein [Eubacterium sp.]
MKNKMMTMVKGLASNPKAVMAAKIMATAIVALIGAVAYGTGAFAAGEVGADFSGVTSPIVGLINSLVTPLLAIVGAGGTIFCIFLGVKFATAEEPQEKEKRKQALKTAIIGFFLIFVLMAALKLSIKPMTDWYQSATSGANGGAAVTTEVTTQ